MDNLEVITIWTFCSTLEASCSLYDCGSESIKREICEVWDASSVKESIVEGEDWVTAWTLMSLHVVSVWSGIWQGDSCTEQLLVESGSLQDAILTLASMTTLKLQSSQTNYKFNIAHQRKKFWNWEVNFESESEQIWGST